MTSCELRLADGTPDGHGYEGGSKSLGNAGTDGTEGSGSVGTAGTEGSTGVTVSCAIMFPSPSTVATTSMLTVRMFLDAACRRWNI